MVCESVQNPKITSLVSMSVAANKNMNHETKMGQSFQEWTKETL